MYESDSGTFIRTGRGGESSYPGTQETLESLNIRIPIEKFENQDIWKPISIPGSYSPVEANPQGFSDFILAPVKGIIAAADIIFFVLIIGGVVGLMNYTGAFNAGIKGITRLLRGREYGLIIIVTLLNALGGTTFGLGEETIAFYPILIPVFIAAGYDSMVAFAAVFAGSNMGIMFSTTNPFSTIIASNTAGINWTNGLDFRVAMWAIGLIICTGYILYYARRVKNDPSRTLVSESFNVPETVEAPRLSFRIIMLLIVFSVCFILMIVGVARLGWWFEEMSAIFLVGAVLIGIAGKIPEKILVNEVIKGAGDLLGVALIIGIARGVTILMDDGLISDTLLYQASTITAGMQKGLFANMLVFIYAGLSFFISSTSGLAVLTMPIMAPLADTVGIGREVVVNSYQFGNGLFNFINPTSLVLPCLAISRISFNEWLKFVLPLMGILLVTIMLAVSLQLYL